MAWRDGVDDEGATSLTDTSRHDARLECRHITVKRPGNIQRRIALCGDALGLSSVSVM